MNFMSREEISMIASVSDLWQTCDGWCSNRCVEKLGSVIWQLQIGHSFSPKVCWLRDLSTDCTHLVPFTPYSRAWSHSFLQDVVCAITAAECTEGWDMAEDSSI